MQVPPFGLQVQLPRQVQVEPDKQSIAQLEPEQSSVQSLLLPQLALQVPLLHSMKQVLPLQVRLHDPLQV